MLYIPKRIVKFTGRNANMKMTSTGLQMNTRIMAGESFNAGQPKSRNAMTAATTTPQTIMNAAHPKSLI